MQIDDLDRWVLVRTGNDGDEVIAGCLNDAGFTNEYSKAINDLLWCPFNGNPCMLGCVAMEQEYCRAVKKSDIAEATPERFELRCRLVRNVQQGTTAHDTPLSIGWLRIVDKDTEAG